MQVLWLNVHTELEDDKADLDLKFEKVQIRFPAVTCDHLTQR